jgi:sucrose-phosphate synthase
MMATERSRDGDGLYIVLVSIHGLIRGVDPELGRDADTGGQVRYVVELARALAEHPDVDKVELLTRQILALELDSQYSEHREQIAERAWIVRLPCGPHRYLRKESLWPHLPEFVDHALRHFREIGRVPDVIHGHYADAGEVAARLAKLLNSTLVFTGHSLGRVKRARLLEKGTDADTIERRYRMSRRIAAEENVIQEADLIVTSTQQEVDEQYGMYTARIGGRTAVIPPGLQLGRFRPPRAGDPKPAFAAEIDRFLDDPGKPMILAIQRPDERKNLATLIDAFAGSASLRERANLVVMIGTRDDISELPASQRKVLQDMLLQIDRHDLYGQVAYPKKHPPEEVPEVFRLAARRRGVFVNPALTEPFGLTLIEAAASGLPVVATRDGGPKEILRLCDNGLLVDPHDANAMAHALERVLKDRKQWRRMARSGVRGAGKHFTWKGHVDQYLRSLRAASRRRGARRRGDRLRVRLVRAERMIVCDIDNTLIGDTDSLERFLAELDRVRDTTAFAVATGRPLESARRVLADWKVPQPDVLITSVGSEIHYGPPPLVEDVGWRRRIDHHWEPDRIRELVADLPGLTLQKTVMQRQFKLSYDVDTDAAPGVRAIRGLLKENGVSARVIFSHDAYLDFLPERASKGLAVRYLADRWGLSLDTIVTAGDSGNDAEMLRCGAAGVVVANHSHEVAALESNPRIYFADASHADGIVEGLRHFEFIEPADGDRERVEVTA